jgi:predicted RNase H-like nuclease
LRSTCLAADALRTIDEIDAALCALAAQHVLAGTFKAYGDEAEGFIVVPSLLADMPVPPIVISI